jgi:hypothetical protein
MFLELAKLFFIQFIGNNNEEPTYFLSFLLLNIQIENLFSTR